MAKYEDLPVQTITPNEAILLSHDLPELVHLEDPASSVMIDFTHTSPQTISADNSLDEAIDEMKATGTHLLLVVDKANHLLGVVSSEDLFGEKPIQMLQERRIPRSSLLVKALMSPLADIIAFNVTIVDEARVGNIVKTLLHHKQHYALVLGHSEHDKKPMIRGLFTAAQISKQLHIHIESALNKASSVSELQKRQDS